jgi:methylmalonyl-CoA mutase N-terminal domain/subunit
MNKPLDPKLPLDAAEARWQSEYAAQIGAERATVNRSGIPVKPLYTPRDWDGSRYAEDVGFPGQAPYTRGIYPTMHRGRTWTQRQLIGLGTPQDYNDRLRGILARGASAVSLIPCNSVFRGYDMDEVHAELLGRPLTVIGVVATFTVSIPPVDVTLPQ